LKANEEELRVHFTTINSVYIGISTKENSALKYQNGAPQWAVIRHLPISKNEIRRDCSADPSQNTSTTYGISLIIRIGENRFYFQLNSIKIHFTNSIKSNLSIPIYYMYRTIANHFYCKCHMIE